MGVDKP